ncbi:NAD(P)H-dependent oxidoreductase [Pseudothauera rhizosphaerae]|uniref:Flavodoxin family protein n=1 Tax=Pseudothauera rhizosphaerae TaxID=2565932 RepID=A0A4S4AVI5_9RHOO|nr:NAD(P)H-dependent oxidoreductase [Pseudothauera rhizosphaerae]THF62556.1 flavodoxin family protein [Pseudothauera rhizosphaerae]
MGRHIAIIQGHPDPGGGRYCHALAAAYADGARSAGHRVDLVDVARLDFPLLRTKEDFEHGAAPPSVAVAQAAMAAADHLILVYPLWLGDMPALLKAFLEQSFRPGFAFGPQQPDGKREGGGLRGKSARIVVTMGMPAFAYRWLYGAHSVKSLSRNVLGFSGMRPVRVLLVGTVEARPAARQRWLVRMEGFGRRAQ